MAAATVAVGTPFVIIVMAIAALPLIFPKVVDLKLLIVTQTGRPAVDKAAGEARPVVRGCSAFARR